MMCRAGCCPGCRDCYGMQIGCHQDPCRCDKPCTCRWADEDDDPTWQAGCERHDSTQDARRLADAEPDYDPEFESLDPSPCVVCGSDGACAYDDEGRPLIHAVADEDIVIEGNEQL